MPLAVAGFFTLRRIPRRAVVTTVVATVAAAMPFVALQFAFNLGTTGRIFYTPYQHYLETQQPGSSFGFHHIDEKVRPQSQLRAEASVLRQVHPPGGAEASAGSGDDQLSARPLAGAADDDGAASICRGFPARRVCSGCATARDRGAAAIAVWSALPMLIVAYAFNAFLHGALHGDLAAADHSHHCDDPGGVAASISAHGGASCPRQVLLFAVAAAVSAQPGVNPHAIEQFQTPVVSDARQKLAALPHPSVVFFGYNLDGDFDDEPVYNIETAWPDDARVVRAHDFGPERNMALVRYSAQRQPERHVYLYDQATKQLHALGPAKALLAAHDAAKPTTQPAQPTQSSPPTP